MNELGTDFFHQSPVECARQLIGCEFLWKGLSGRIVETEAYAALGDPACHTFFRKGAREFVAKHPAGIAYVYLNYGVHWLFNLLVKDPKNADMAGFVLLRALEPLEGVEIMRRNRPEITKKHLLCAGPGRLTRALGIDASAHGQDFLAFAGCGIRIGHASKIVSGPRIGISRAQDFPWRFGDPSSASLSAKFPAI